MSIRSLSTGFLIGVAATSLLAIAWDGDPVPLHSDRAGGEAAWIYPLDLQYPEDGYIIQRGSGEQEVVVPVEDPVRPIGESPHLQYQRTWRTP